MTIPIHMLTRGINRAFLPPGLAGEAVFAPRDRWFDTAAHIYHYTKRSTFVDIAASREFRAYRFAVMNDPRESKEWPASAFQVGQSVPDIDQEALAIELNRQKDNVKIAAFAQDSISPVPTTPYAGAGFARPALWAHYAERHAGVCVCFDRVSLLQRFESAVGDPTSLLAAAVDYSSLQWFGDASFEAVDATRIEVSGLQEGIRQHLKSLRSAWFEKHPDWSPEVEYRIVYPDETDREYLAVDVSGCIVALILGADCSESDLQIVMEAAEALGIGTVGRSVWTGPCWGIQEVESHGGAWRFVPPVRVVLGGAAITHPPEVPFTGWMPHARAGW